MSLFLAWLNAALGFVAFFAWGKRLLQSYREWQYRFFAGGISLVGLFFGIYYCGLLFGVISLTSPIGLDWMRLATTLLLIFVTFLALLRE